MSGTIGPRVLMQHCRRAVACPLSVEGYRRSALMEAAYAVRTAVRARAFMHALTCPVLSSKTSVVAGSPLLSFASLGTETTLIDVVFSLYFVRVRQPRCL